MEIPIEKIGGKKMNKCCKEFAEKIKRAVYNNNKIPYENRVNLVNYIDKLLKEAEKNGK